MSLIILLNPEPESRDLELVEPDDCRNYVGRKSGSSGTTGSERNHHKGKGERTTLTRCQYKRNKDNQVKTGQDDSEAK